MNAWVASGQTDSSRLLRGQALRDAQFWSRGKSLSDLDYRFLAASEVLDRQDVELRLEAERVKEVEARLGEEQKRRVQEQKNSQAPADLARCCEWGAVDRGRAGDICVLPISSRHDQ